MPAFACPVCSHHIRGQYSAVHEYLLFGRVQVQLKTSKRPKEGSKPSKGGKRPRGQGGTDVNEGVAPLTKKQVATDPRQVEDVTPEALEQQQEADGRSQVAPQPDASPVEGLLQPEAAPTEGHAAA